MSPYYDTGAAAKRPFHGARGGGRRVDGQVQNDEWGSLSVGVKRATSRDKRGR